MRRVGDITRRCNPECAARRPELRLLDIQKARGIPYPDDIFAWREANAAAIAALEVRAEPAVREAEAGP